MKASATSLPAAFSTPGIRALSIALYHNGKPVIQPEAANSIALSR
jgi:hypothetical protein